MRKIIIDKFGPVEHAEIDIKRYNLFIGQQSIGKSTIAKLITIFTDHINLLAILVGGRDSWKSLLEEYSLNTFIFNQNYRVEYIFEKGTLNGHITIDRNDIRSSFLINGKREDDIHVITQAFLRNKPIYHTDQLKERLRQTVGKHKSKDVVDLMKDSLYVPAERNIFSIMSKISAVLMLSGSMIPKTLLRFIVEMTKAREHQHKWEIPMLNLSYVYDNEEDYFVVQGRKKPFPLRTASSGIQSLLPLYIVINYALQNEEYSSYVVEEPECNLFPDKQIELLRYLLLAINEEGMTLTLTTHSPYILSAMNNYLLAGNLMKENPSISKEMIRERVGNIPILDSDNCAVYSLGKEINGDVYCKSLIDPEVGMIDANTLDGISVHLSDEFDKIDQLNFEAEEHA